MIISGTKFNSVEECLKYLSSCVLKGGSVVYSGSYHVLKDRHHYWHVFKQNRAAISFAKRESLAPDTIVYKVNINR
jgi:hypothetical protein